MNVAIWLMPFLLPMLLAGVIGLTRPSDRMVGFLLGLGAVPAFLLAVFDAPLADVDFARFFLGAHFELDPLKRVFLLFTSILWGLAGWFNGSYQAHDENRIRFDVFFLLSMAGNLGLILAADIVTFYAFFVLMTFSAFGLVVHTWTKEAQRAGHIYLILAVVGEVFLLAAIFLAVDAAGSILISDLAPAVAEDDNRHLIIAFSLLGFGVKVGALPLYFWLPLAHPAAPTPASAVLSAAMLKAGLLGWIHLFPLGAVNSPSWGGLMIGMGLLAALGAALVGLTQTHPKAALAYSSISQMGLLTIFVGLGWKAGHEWTTLAPGVAFFALHHGLAKGALFLGTGVVAVTRQAGNWILAGLLIPGLALAGLPGTSGYLAKDSLKKASSFASPEWEILLSWGLPLSGFLTSLLIGRVLWTCHQAMGKNPHGTAHGLIPAWLILLSLLLTSPWWAAPFCGLAPTSFSFGSWLAAALPLLAAALILGGCWRRGWFSRLPGSIPPGDLLIPIEKLAEHFLARCQQIFGERWEKDVLNIMFWVDRIIAFERGRSLVDRVETFLRSWAMVGVLFILTIASLFWALLL